MRAINAIVIVLALSGCNIKPDKVGHFISGAFISVIVTSATGKPGQGLAVACAAGAAKELYDSFGAGQVEFADFAATCSGGGVGFAFD